MIWLYDETYTRICFWFDPYIRLWTIYLTDDEQNQVCPAEYCPHRDDVWEEIKYLRREVGQDLPVYKTGVKHTSSGYTRTEKLIPDDKLKAGRF